MFVTLKALPWLFPFLRELFKRGRRRPTSYKRDPGKGSAVFLITGFFIVISVIVLFSGEKIVTLMMENGNLKQENLTLRYSRETDRELITQLQTSNETRGRQVDAVVEQNQLLREDVRLLLIRNQELDNTLTEFMTTFKSFEKDWYQLHFGIDKNKPKETTKQLPSRKANSIKD